MYTFSFYGYTKTKRIAILDGELCGNQNPRCQQVQILAKVALCAPYKPTVTNQKSGFARGLLGKMNLPLTQPWTQRDMCGDASSFTFVYQREPLSSGGSRTVRVYEPFVYVRLPNALGKRKLTGVRDLRGSSARSSQTAGSRTRRPLRREPVAEESHDR